jgi:hypothetical protein
VLPLPIRIAGGMIAAVVIGGVPRLAGRRALGKEGWFTRLVRDVSGIAVLAPVLLGGASPTLPLRLRLAAVVAVVFLVSLDSLRTERLSIRLTILFALLVAAIVLGGSAVVGANSAHTGLRAAVLLVLWYGARGVAGAVGGPLRRPGLVAEYAVFVVAAGAGLIWINTTHL